MEEFIIIANEQKKELETIRDRKITVKLSDADCDRLARKCGEHGLTIGELIENFVGDLVDGTHHNGSDEVDYANQWFDRCWFGMFPEPTLLNHLLNWGYEPEHYLDMLENVETIKSDIEITKQNIAEPSDKWKNIVYHKYNDDRTSYKCVPCYNSVDEYIASEKEDLESYKANLEVALEELNDLRAAWKPEKEPNMDEEIELIKKWMKERDDFINGKKNLKFKRNYNKFKGVKQMNNNMMVDGAYWTPRYRDAVLILKEDVYYLQSAKMNFTAPEENDLRIVSQDWAKNVSKTECQKYEYDMLGLEKMKTNLPEMYGMQLQNEDFKYQYLLINGSSLSEKKWSNILKELPFKFIGHYNIEKSMDMDSISLEDSVPTSFLQSRSNMLYVVDSYKDIIDNNNRIFNYRGTFKAHDIFLDLQGNVMSRQKITEIAEQRYKKSHVQETTKRKIR